MIRFMGRLIQAPFVLAFLVVLGVLLIIVAGVQWLITGQATKATITAGHIPF